MSAGYSTPCTARSLLVCAASASANGGVGVHGAKVDLHLQDLWDRNITITTRLVDAVSTPMLLKLVESGKLDASKLITHRKYRSIDPYLNSAISLPNHLMRKQPGFKFSEIEKAYEIFGKAAQHQCLKVIIDMEE